MLFAQLKSIFFRPALSKVYDDNLYQTLRDLDKAEENAEAWIAQRDMLKVRAERLRGQIDAQPPF